MDEDAFNMSIRKFLKTVGVTAQREIEQAVRKAVEDGALEGTESLVIEARISLPGAGLEKVVAGTITLA